MHARTHTQAPGKLAIVRKVTDSRPTWTAYMVRYYHRKEGGEEF